MPFEPDASQQAALAATGSLLVLGPPGSGKTEVALETVRRALADGVPAQRVVLLTATRRAATELRARLARIAPVTSGAPLVRTAPSLAFSILRTRATLLGEVAPTLISGAEQDAILSELLAGHDDPSVRPLPWPEWLKPEALKLRAFRDELRDLLMRAAERGVSPAELRDLGVAAGRQEWVGAAYLYQEYLDTTRLGATVLDVGDRFDPAVIVAEAVHALTEWADDLPQHDRPTWDLVVVDDYQEATAATIRLVDALARDGARVVLLADPDSATQGYRGAAPWLVARAGHPVGVAGAYDSLGAFGVDEVELGAVWRHGPQLREVARRVTAGIPAIAGGRRRMVGLGDDASGDAGQGDGVLDDAGRGGDASGDAGRGSDDALGTDAVVSAAILRSEPQQVAYLAGLLRRAHLYDCVPWSQMAVLTRTNAAAAALRSDLAAAGVPIASGGATGPLVREPVVSALLTALAVADDPASLDTETATVLALSPLGGFDSTGLRRVRRALRAAELAAGGERLAGDLLVEAVSDPDVAAGARSRQMQRLAEILAAGRLALGRGVGGAQGDATGFAGSTGGAQGDATGFAGSTGGVADALWAIWDTAGLAERWRRASLAGDARADRDLDAVMALFAAVEQYEDRTAAATVAGFTDLLARQEFATDTLAATGLRPDTVTVTTVAGAAGREWDLVAVTGLQDGIWPDLRLRDSVLGAGTLTEVLAARERLDRSDDPDRVRAAARRAVLADELRLLHVACTRPRQRLVVTAVDDADTHPSAFLDLVVPADPGVEVDSRRVQVRPGADLRAVVAQARANVEAGVAPGADEAAVAVGQRSAALLARLAAEGVAGADPTEWQAAPVPSSAASIFPAGAKPVLSPSRLETADRCPLRYVLTMAGGEQSASYAQSIGSIVHEIAERHPAGGLAAMQADLDEAWSRMGSGDGWEARHQRRQAERIVANLAAELERRGAPIATEYRFEVELPDVVLTGSIDRVERVAGSEQEVRLVDLKTGKTKPTVAEAQQHPQLGAYQVAVANGALDRLVPGATPAGADLVYLADSSPRRRVQDPLADGTWATDLISRAVADLADASVEARVGEWCRHCPVRGTCPAIVEGTRVRS